MGPLLSGSTGLRAHLAAIALIACSFHAAGIVGHAQFKQIGPAPIPPAVARQRFRTLLERVDAENTQRTIKTLTDLTPWYRDLLDEELIAAWKKENRGNLPAVIDALADPHVASEIIVYSWRQDRQGAFRPAYAPLLGHLMARYAESAKPFLDDLLRFPATGQPALDLSPAEAETVCRILLDMPDIETWKTSALKILPHYRRDAAKLLDQDLRAEDLNTRYRALRWLADLAAVDPAFDAQRRAASGLPAMTANPLHRRPEPGATNKGEYRSGTGGSPPTITSKIEPEYTEVARKLRVVDAVVLVRLIVQSDGTPRDIKVVRGMGYGLDENAADALRKWRFNPGIKDGNAVAAQAQIQINFRILRQAGEAKTWYSGPMAFRAETGATPPIVRDGNMPKPVRESSDETAVLEFTVDPRGDVTNISMVSGSNAASTVLPRSLATWKFEPAMKDNQPVEATGRIRFFKGQGDESLKRPLLPPQP